MRPCLRRLFIAAALALLPMVGQAATTVNDRTARATDGDTLKDRNGLIRLYGYNAPETRTAQCPLEREAGQAAKVRLQELLRGGLILTRPPNTPNLDRWGRRIRQARTLIGQLVQTVMIEEKLALPYLCPRNRCPTRHQWCRDHLLPIP